MTPWAFWRESRDDRPSPSHSNGAGRRPRQAHAPDHQHDPKAAREGRRQDAARLGSGLRWRRVVSQKRSSTFIISPNRSSAHVASRTKPHVVISDESRELLDSAGGIVNALPELGSRPFYILNADTFWIEGQRPTHGRNLARLALAWEPGAMDILLMLADLDQPPATAARPTFSSLRDGRLSARGRRSGRIDLCRRRDRRSGASSRARRQCRIRSTRYFDRAIAAGRLFGMAMDGSWITVGTPDAIPLPRRPSQRARTGRS